MMGFLQSEHVFATLTGIRGWLCLTLLLTALSAAPQLAHASSTCNGNQTVTVSATGVAFGSYDVFTTTSTAGIGTVTVSANCQHNGGQTYILTYSVALSSGSAGSFTPRLMNAGSAHLQYNLYTDTTLTTIWGDGSSGTDTVSGSITGTCNGGGNQCNGQQTSTVYANIPAMQNVPSGSYSDTISVTVSF